MTNRINGAHGNRPPRLDVDTSYRYAVLRDESVCVHYWDGVSINLTWICEPGSSDDMQYVLKEITSDAAVGTISHAAASELHQMLRYVFERAT